MRSLKQETRTACDEPSYGFGASGARFYGVVIHVLELCETVFARCAFVFVRRHDDSL